MRRILMVAVVSLIAAMPASAEPRAGDLWLGLAAGRQVNVSFFDEDFGGLDEFDGYRIALSIEHFPRAWWSYGAQGTSARLEAPDAYGGTVDASSWGLGAFTRVQPPIGPVTVRMTLGFEAAYCQVDSEPPAVIRDSEGASAGVWSGLGLVVDFRSFRLTLDGECSIGPELADTGAIFIGRYMVGIDYALRRGVDGAPQP